MLFFLEKVLFGAKVRRSWHFQAARRRLIAAVKLCSAVRRLFFWCCRHNEKIEAYGFSLCEKKSAERGFRRLRTATADVGGSRSPSPKGETENFTSTFAFPSGGRLNAAVKLCSALTIARFCDKINIPNRNGGANEKI